ncbi:uncharacterized protein LOC106657420 [Trichogramma pretiosum]|uniref:uncharacterized protein LOC106657420 n=1 Tax=Trichogramma pretiosum TaxID=7493 RepID=UPI0006C95A76|nr:uncharacterized protein LOC106657420 [Trichogramma pretiosum]
MLANKNENEETVKIICPSINELTKISVEVRCSKCDSVFSNESCYRFHDLKVHQQKNIEKVIKQNVKFHCPIENCIYAIGNQKHFTLFKYVKQHYLKVHADKNFVCRCCSKGFSTKAAREAHVKICGQYFICNCKKNFNSYEALLTHAKRNSHKFDDKYRLKKNKNGIKNVCQQKSAVIKLIPILPKPTCDVGTQINEDMFEKKSNSRKILKKQICRQTQTTEASKDKQQKKSAETQTLKSVPRVIRVKQVEKRKNSNANEKQNNKIAEIKSDLNFLDTLNSILLDSPLAMKHNIILEDAWEEKSNSGTQTSPIKTVFEDIDNDKTKNCNFNKLTKSDPMLTEQAYNDRFNSIETQTEKEPYQLVFESDPMSSNIETQTTDNYTETEEQLHIYSNICTQTCNEILPSDLGLSDIQTQTAWSHLDDTTVSTETQTKAFKCLSGCDSSSWFTTPTQHMETQTEFYQIFKELD